MDRFIVTQCVAGRGVTTFHVVDTASRRTICETCNKPDALSIASAMERAAEEAASGYQWEKAPLTAAETDYSTVEHLFKPQPPADAPA